MLEVQKYLMSGKTLSDLTNEFGIHTNQYKTLVALNYDMIDSPKSHPIVLDCRGLILEIGSWKVISYPFRRFFNINEVPELTGDFDYSTAVGLQKLDGTLIELFNYNDEWLMSTRMIIQNDIKILFTDFTFLSLFHETVKHYQLLWQFLDKSYTYVFELTAPENRVVTIYDKRELHLLTVRNQFLKEVPLEELQEWSRKIGVPIPIIVDIGNKQSIIDLAKNLATLEEGFVAVNYNQLENDGLSFKRIKIKNPSYVAIAHIKDRACSTRALLGLIYDNQQDEFVGYFPEFASIVNTIKTKWDSFLKRIEEDELKYMDTFQLDKKSFASNMKQWKNTSYMFMRYEKKVGSFKEFLNNLEKNKSRKYLEKYLVDCLQIKDVTFE